MIQQFAAFTGFAGFRDLVQTPNRETVTSGSYSGFTANDKKRSSSCKAKHGQATATRVDGHGGLGWGTGDRRQAMQYFRVRC